MLFQSMGEDTPELAFWDVAAALDVLEAVAKIGGIPKVATNDP